jgi:hypothetical protein
MALILRQLLRVGRLTGAIWDAWRWSRRPRSFATVAIPLQLSNQWITIG